MAVGEFGMLPVVLLAKLLRKAAQGRNKALGLLAAALPARPYRPAAD
jgi:hypothetical protein